MIESGPSQPAAPPPTGLTAPGRALAPFRFPAFRAIWTANFASNIGSMIQSVGASWLMTGLTQSHQLISLVQASTTTPVMLLGMFAGAIADNYDRRLVMLAAQWLMLAASGLLAALAWSGHIGPWSLLAFTLLVGAGTALNGPAWQASVRLQVGRGDLAQAISLNTIAFNLARSVGPALGGILIALTSPAAAFALNSLSFVALIFVLSRWHPEQPSRTRQPMLASIVTGVRFCAGSSPVRRVLARGFAFGFCGVGFLALLPVVVRGQIGGSEFDYGLLLGSFGLGSILTALWIAPLRRRFGSEAVVGTASVLFALALFPLASAHSMGLALSAGMVAGGSWVSALSSLNVAMQLRSPEDILGRCMAIYQSVTFGGMALGAYALGLLADVVGVPGSIRCAAILLLALAPLLRWLAPMPARDEGRIRAT
ncbi:MAG: MFS transporter [Novosphingobium sp.]